MPATTRAFLPIDFSQLFDLAKQLPKDEQLHLAGLLMQEDAADDIPEDQKNIVRGRIKKYNENPELLIDEIKAMELIKQM